jgi:hypothetical protein
VSGRRFKLTPDVATSVVRDITAGAPRAVAAARAGISESSLESWIARARALRDVPPELPCPVCGADGDLPCRTASGRLAATPHAGRHAQAPGGDNERLLEFLASVEKAEADAHARNLLLIQTAAQGGTWQAAAWFLERKYPHLYGRRAVEVSGPERGPIQVDLATSGLADGVSTARLIELALRHGEPDDARLDD